MGKANEGQSLMPLRRLIPRRKINGQRFGQLLSSAITKMLEQDDSTMGYAINNRLFYIENQELDKLLRKYIKEYTCKPRLNDLLKRAIQKQK